MNALSAESLSALVSAARVRSLDIVRATYERHAIDDSPSSQPELMADVRVRLRRKESYPRGLLTYLCEAHVTWNRHDEPYASAAATLRAAYALEGLDRELDEAEIVAFGEQVALHQAWPFLRERLRTFSVELGLPPFLLPLKPLRNALAEETAEGK